MRSDPDFTTEDASLLAFVDAAAPVLKHPIVATADALAAAAHLGQLRKFTNVPYITHPRAVARIVAVHIEDPNVLAAALLHDVLEDTSMRSNIIREECGVQTESLVIGLTNVSRPENGNRPIRKALDLDHLAAGGPEVQSIKLADVSHNRISIVRYDPKFAVRSVSEALDLVAALDKGHPALRKQAARILVGAARGLGIAIPPAVMELSLP